MGQKGSVLPIILVVLVLGALGGFLWIKYQNTSDSKTQPVFQIPKPAPTIKTYQDNQLNFQFEYPQVGFEVAPDGEENYFKITATDHRKNFAGYVGYQPPAFIGGVMLKKSGDSVKPDYGTIPFVLWVFDNPNELSIDSWFDKYWYYPFVWGIFAQPGKGHIYPGSEATISGQPARAVVVSYQPGKPEFTYVAYGDKMFMFKVIKEADEKVISRVLSSFKFTQ